MPRPAPRTAFTLIELMVVIAIITILVALLLPAVQRARDAARKVQCSNWLKQLGLGLHNYHDHHNTFPPGYIYRPNPSTSPPNNGAGFGWGAMCLPFLDEQPTYKEIDWDVPIYDDRNKTPRERRLQVFLCPSDFYSVNGYVHMGDTERYAMASYVASFGPPDLDANQEQRLGVFSRNSKIGLEGILDGASQTLLLGERTNGPFRTRGSNGVHFYYETTWAGAVREVTEPDDDHGHMVLFHTGHAPNDPLSDDRDVSAPHFGYANFLFCDGACRPIMESIDVDVYQALGTRAGGEVIGEF